MAQFMLYMGAVSETWNLVVEPNADEHFTWSPDGKRFACVIHHNKHLQSSYLRSVAPTSEVIVMSLDRTSREVVLDKPGIWLPMDWSPDESKLLLGYVSEWSSSSRIYDTLSLYELNLSELESERRNAQLPDIDAATIVVDLFLKEVSTDIGRNRFTSARYSPDGKQIAAVHQIDAAGNPQRPRPQNVLCVIDRMSRETRTITAFPGLEGLRGPICWSPSGHQILCSRYLSKSESQKKEKTDNGLAIWSFQIDGKESAFLTTGWSPEWR